MDTTANLHGRHPLTLRDYSRAEITYLIDLAAELKSAKREGREEQRLRGKNIAMVFEEDSIRTRSAFEVASYDQGAQVTFISATGSPIGHRETVKDTARVLGRIYDAIEYRGSESIADELATWAGIPVFTGLTDECHPTQTLAAFLTFEERVSKPLDEVSFCYLGDARLNMADGYLLGGAKLGMDVRVAGPRQLWPRQDTRDVADGIAQRSGAHIEVTEDVEPAVQGADVLLAHVWVSMGGLAEACQERIDLLLPYQINAHTMALTGNPNVKFMHCLPACHNSDTHVGRELYDRYGLAALEVTEEVFESSASIVFDAAENRMHTIKAVLVATLAT